MMFVKSSLLLLLATAVSVSNGFAFDVFSAFQPASGLSTMAEAQIGQKFSVKMDIGKKDETHIFLDGLAIELLQEDAPKSDNIGLPGASGPHPKTSTGALKLNVLSNPSFIDLFGTQKVRFEKGCWELVWKKDQYCGSIICGFDVPVGAKRNGANLPSGRLYMSFPVWEQEGLSRRQTERLEAEEKAKEFAEEKDEELRKMQTTSNLFMKALHYRNAVAAVEKIDFTGVRWLSQIPMGAEVVPIGNGLLMNTKGTVWSKEPGFFGKKHDMLGNAVLAHFDDQDSDVDSLRP